MKKRLIFSLMALFMLSMTFVSCGDDDDDDKGGASLVGTWKAVSGTYVEDGKTHNYNFSDEFYITMVFTDKTVTTTASDGKDTDTDTRSYTLSGNKIVIPGDEGVSTYSLSGDTLTITITYDDGGNEVITFKRQ
jgi:hypothetical protein